jgi:diguanylate cyclase (GGDEF)-like protein
MLLHSSRDRLVEQYYLNDDLLQIKNVIRICIFFVSLLAYGDYLNFGFLSAFYAVVFARAFFLLLSIITLFALNYVKSVQQRDYLIAVWSVLFIALVFYVNASRPLANINFSYIDPLLVLALFLVLPCNIYLRGILAGILAIGDIIIIGTLKNPINSLSFQTITMSYALAYVLGIFIANRLQQFRQKQYRVFLREQHIRHELEKVAFTDPLTGVLNRRKFFQLGSLEFDQFKIHATSFSILMMDVDFFKHLNDKFGHAAGDDYLKEFTKIIIENKRSKDILGRIGGEEFALILPETDLEAALLMAERLRQICEEKVVFFNNQPLHTTVSIGLTKVWRKDRVFLDVLKRADEALYQAKRNGRNQVQLQVKDA